MGYRGLDKDITRYKKTEEMLRQKIGELEQFERMCMEKEMKMIKMKKEIEELSARLVEIEK